MTFDEWWAKQPKDPTEPITPRMAWDASRKDAFAIAAEHARSHGKTLAAINDNEAMEFAGKAIGDSISPLTK